MSSIETFQTEDSVMLPVFNKQKISIEKGISENVEKMGNLARQFLFEIKNKYPDRVCDIRGKGLLLLIDFETESLAIKAKDNCRLKGLLVTQTNQTGIRIFPALNIEKQELEEGLNIFAQSVASLHEDQY